MADPKWTVGQVVVIRDVNGRKDHRLGEVVKVGRKLVTVRPSWGRDEVYRMNGRANDAYGRRSIQTEQECADAVRRGQIVKTLRAAGVEARGAGLTADQLERIAAIVQEQQ